MPSAKSFWECRRDGYFATKHHGDASPLTSLPTLKTWTLGRKWTKRGLSSYTNGSGSLWLPIDSVSMTTRSRDASILQLHPLRCVCVSTPFYPLLKARRGLWVSGRCPARNMREMRERWEHATAKGHPSCLFFFLVVTWLQKSPPFQLALPLGLRSIATVECHLATSGKNQLTRSDLVVFWRT